MDNPEKLATSGTQDEEKQRHNTMLLCVGYHFTQTRTNNVNNGLIVTSCASTFVRILLLSCDGTIFGRRLSLTIYNSALKSLDQTNDLPHSMH